MYTFENSIIPSILVYFVFIFLTLHEVREIWEFPIEEGSEFLFFLLDDIGIFEMIGQLLSSLNAGIADLRDLVRVELFPLFVMELSVESFNKLGMEKVEESIANITVILHKNILYIGIDG